MNKQKLDPKDSTYNSLECGVVFYAGWPTSSRQARVKELAELRLQVLVVVKTSNG
jgi:hypothetical protein